VSADASTRRSVPKSPPPASSGSALAAHSASRTSGKERRCASGGTVPGRKPNTETHSAGEARRTCRLSARREVRVTFLSLASRNGSSLRRLAMTATSGSPLTKTARDLTGKQLPADSASDVRTRDARADRPSLCRATCTSAAPRAGAAPSSPFAKLAAASTATPSTDAAVAAVVLRWRRRPRLPSQSTSGAHQSSAVGASSPGSSRSSCKAWRRANRSTATWASFAA